MRIKGLFLLVVGVLLVVAAACAPNATPTPTAAPTVAPTLAPTQVPTLAPTAVPTLVPTQAPTLAPTLAPTDTPTSEPEIARPSNPGEAGKAITLAGNAAAGAKIYTKDCVTCHAAEGKGGIANPGSTDGSVPALNPIDETLKSSNYLTFAYNLDLFIEHGSTPAGASPAFKMTAWGDQKLMTPQQIADVIAYVISLNDPTLKPTVTTNVPAPAEISSPSNPGGAGMAITLTGDEKSGAQIFVKNCVSCHGGEGKGDIANPGTDDKTVPALNPIDDTLKSKNLVAFAYNLDLFMEHGSTPAGASPTFKMTAWGDTKMLTPQQIADVIAYVISLNK